MFKEAYVRGIQNCMIQSGHVSFPDENSAAKIASYIADHIELSPLDGPVSREVTASVVGHIIDASKELARQGYKAGSFAKVASVQDLGQLAHAHAIDLMQKAAEGSTIEGGDKGNKENQSTQAEAKMDEKHRPEGYATDSRGTTAVDTKPGEVGKQQTSPAAPAESPIGDNSVTRTASLEDLIRKVAETGSTIMGGDKGNKEMSSSEAKMDKAQRPEGYAVLPSQGSLGQVMAQVSGAAVVGKEVAQPNKPSNSPAGSNSVVETSHKAAAEDPFLALFKKTAAEVVPYLPLMDEAQKVGHVRALMGLTTEEKAAYINGLNKDAAEKTAASLPPGTQSYSEEHNPDKTHSRPGAYDGRKGNQGTKHAGDLPAFLENMKDKDEKKEEKKEDKGEKSESKSEEKKEEKEEKKEEKAASLGDRLRQIVAQSA
jgi:hypothetical protein